MKKWLLAIGLLLLAILAALVVRHNRTSRAIVALPPSFEEVEDPAKSLPSYAANLSHTEWEWLAAKQDIKMAIRRQKYSWNCPAPCTLGPTQVQTSGLLSAYRAWAARPVFLASNLKYFVVDGFQFTAHTPQGILRDFEKMMNTNHVVFVRDKTNAVWVMRATNELAFRRKFGLAKWWHEL